MDFQDHLIKAQSDLHERQQTSCQGGYTSAGMNNLVGILDTFANLVQVTEEDRATVTNFTMENSTLKEQVGLYANLFSTKEVDNDALKKAVGNLYGEVKNLKAELATMKKSSHSGGTGSMGKDKFRTETKWKR